MFNLLLLQFDLDGNNIANNYDFIIKNKKFTTFV